MGRICVRRLAGGGAGAACGPRAEPLASVQGFEVVAASDGESAIGLVQESAFDGVLLDLTMPGMTGVEVFRAIKCVRPDLPIVLTSGYSRQQTAARFDGADVDGFIQKPFLPSALVRAMQAAVSSRATGRVA